MPKLPRVSGAQAVRALERLGFAVPNHRELKTGTLAGVLKQAGISAEDFISAL